MFKRSAGNNQGFTLVELMIALSVFSTILVMSTVVLTQIGKWYSKGVNAANLQNASRTVMADVTSALQFNGGSFRTGTPISDGGATVKAWCINNVRYSYVEGRELGSDQGYQPTAQITNHVLWRDTMKTSANCNPLHLITANGSPTDNDSLGTDGYEMLGNHMRLTTFSITESGGIYTVTVNSAFGDNDLVVNNGGTALCNGGPGTEYCSASNLTTTVKKRLE